MNKTVKVLKRIGKKTYTFIDKVIVTPISTLIYKIQNKIGKGNKLEKILNRPNVLLYLSLALAIVIFCFVDSEAVTLVNTNAEILREQPVVVKYNSSAYVIEGVPETVDITLIGTKSELYLAKQLGDNQVEVDLSGYEASDTPVKVPLTYKKNINSIDYKVDPSYVSVIIKKKVSDKKTVTYDLLNRDSLDEKLSVKSVSLSQTVVTVRGSQDTLNRIATIKALVDLDRDEFTNAGTYTVDELELVAYDNKGELINNVEFVATGITATVTLESYSKTVPLKINTTGTLVTGKAISSITINGNNADNFEVTIYGDEASLDSITSIPINIDVDKQGNNGSKKINVSVDKPAGVRYISQSNVKIELNFAESKQKTITLSGIKTRNVPNGLVANLGSADAGVIEVQVIGVESVISAIEDNDPKIYAYVDLKDRTEGTYDDVKVYIEGSDSRVEYVVLKPVSIILSKSS